MIYLNVPLTWSPPVTRPIDMIFFKLFVHKMGYLKGKNTVRLSISEVHMLLYHTLILLVFICSMF